MIKLLVKTGLISIVPIRHSVRNTKSSDQVLTMKTLKEHPKLPLEANVNAFHFWKPEDIDPLPSDQVQVRGGDQDQVSKLYHPTLPLHSFIRDGGVLDNDNYLQTLRHIRFLV